MGDRQTVAAESREQRAKRTHSKGNREQRDRAEKRGSTRDAVKEWVEWRDRKRSAREKTEKQDGFADRASLAKSDARYGQQSEEKQNGATHHDGTRHSRAVSIRVCLDRYEHTLE